MKNIAILKADREVLNRFHWEDFKAIGIESVLFLPMDAQLFTGDHAKEEINHIHKLIHEWENDNA